MNFKYFIIISTAIKKYIEKTQKYLNTIKTNTMFHLNYKKSVTYCQSYIYKIFLTTLIVVLFLASPATAAQVNTLTLTVEKTEQLINEGKLQEAYKIMKRYQKYNSTDFNATWKTAQLAYFNWDMENAKKYYKEAIKLEPANYAVKYDYSKMLFANGDYEQAAELLKQYRTFDSKTPEVWLYSIKSYYYQNELKKALDLYKEMPENFEYNYDLSVLKEEIQISKAMTINLSTTYIDDNQPLQTFTPKIRVSKMHNSFLHWYIEGSFNSFSNDSLNTNSQTFKVGNKIIFNKLNLRADASIGATILPNAKESAIIGGLMLSQKLGEGFALNAELSRNPYYYSVPSTTNFVLQDNVGIALSITDMYKFSGNIQFQKQFFNDDNIISASSFWFLSPGFGNKSIKAKIGYAYQGMDAEKDNFTATRSVKQIKDDFNTNPSVEGIYMSYFTPKKQQIHNALLALDFNLSAKFKVNLAGSYAISAKRENPYLFLNEDIDGNLFIDKGYLSEKFQPATYKANINYTLNRKFNIGLQYDYFKTAFYTANTFMLNLNYRIISEK